MGRSKSTRNQIFGNLKSLNLARNLIDELRHIEQQLLVLALGQSLPKRRSKVLHGTVDRAAVDPAILDAHGVETSERLFGLRAAAVQIRKS